MGIPTVGSIVLVRFPHSDLKSYKLRPALVVAHAEFNDLILCQITSKGYTSKHAVPLGISDFATGKLPVESFIRPDKIFTADKGLVTTVLATVSERIMKATKNRLGGIFNI
ncbi:type II toxin-antitoxin system PemK/MazF family toxin [Candidatus Saccharibacteria bacterium]|nr:type II toxin-antitoxin system PemK/MazF family toxin [Candidatus Saccharibacteria bacterium]